MSLATSIGSSAIFNEPTASLFQSCRAEVLVDRPARDVWWMLIDVSFEGVKRWNPSVISVKQISGAPRQENELVLVTKDPSEGQAPFYMRSIRIVPNQQRVVRIETIDGSNAVFVDHSLYESNGKTRLVYSGYIETRGVPADQIKAFDSKKAESVMMDYLNLTHGMLKQAIEAAPKKT